MNGELKDCKTTQVQGSRSGMSVLFLQYMFGSDDVFCCEIVSDKKAEVLCVSDKRDKSVARTMSLLEYCNIAIDTSLSVCVCVFNNVCMVLCWCV